MLQDHATMGDCRNYLQHALSTLLPEREALAQLRMIIEHLGYTLPGIIASAHDRVPPETVAQIKEIVRELRSGRPIQYILGHAWFHDMKLIVNDKVLIPRPETEELVSRVLQSQKKHPSSALDLCSGSGCIALALKRNLPQTRVTGVELSEEALQVARNNMRRQKLDVHWMKADVLDAAGFRLQEEVDLIVSNPPYVMEKEKALMEAHVLDYEPELALFVPDQDPLLFYRAIARIAASYLVQGGRAWVEINEQLGSETRSTFLNEGFSRSVIHKDIYQKERYVEAVK